MDKKYLRREKDGPIAKEWVNIGTKELFCLYRDTKDIAIRNELIAMSLVSL